MLAGSSRILNSSCSRTSSQLQVSRGFGRPFLAFVAFFGLILFRETVHIRALLWIFCLSRMAEGFLCVGETKRLVLAPLHLVLPFCF